MELTEEQIRKQKKNRTYYEKHRDELLAKKKAKYEQNKEAKLEWWREYYARNHDEILERQRERRRKNREAINAQRRKRRKVQRCVERGVNVAEARTIVWAEDFNLDDALKKIWGR